MLTVHFKIIISWDWLNRIGYFLGYELVEWLEVCMVDKERIWVVEMLVLSSIFVRNPYVYNRLLEMSCKLFFWQRDSLPWVLIHTQMKHILQHFYKI